MISSLSFRERFLVLYGSLFFAGLFIDLIHVQYQRKSGFSLKTKQTLCNFKPVTDIFSTERDAIFTATTVYNEKIDYLVKSFCTTGCRAKLYIFTPDDVIFPCHILMKNVIQVKMGPLSMRTVKSPYKIRWEWYYTFLSENLDKIDRVMHTDAFDAVFLGDPFALTPSNDTLYVQLEDYMIKSCSYNKNWVKSCHPYVSKSFLRNTIACSGSLAGGARPFLEFVKTMITHAEWPICWGHGSDQGDFNYILWTNYTDFKFKIEKMNCSSGFITMNYCNKLVNIEQKDDSLVLNNNRPLVFMHQYNRFEKTTNFVLNVCK